MAYIFQQPTFGFDKRHVIQLLDFTLPVLPLFHAFILKTIMENIDSFLRIFHICGSETIQCVHFFFPILVSVED